MNELKIGRTIVECVLGVTEALELAAVQLEKLSELGARLIATAAPDGGGSEISNESPTSSGMLECEEPL